MQVNEEKMSWKWLSIIVLVILLISTSSTPVFAALPPPGPPPPGPGPDPDPSPSPNGGGGDVYGGYAGQFLVGMFGFGNHQGYKWVEDEGWRYGKTLAEPVSQIATYYNWGFRATYKLEIPESTVVTDYWGRKIFHLQFKLIGGEYCFSPRYLKFSKPVILYELVDDEWVEVLKFNQTSQGKASLVDS